MVGAAIAPMASRVISWANAVKRILAVIRELKR